MKKGTTVILGAGASVDAGFPIGTKLIDRIIAFFSSSKNIESVKRILWNCREEIKRGNLTDILPAEIAGPLTSEKVRDFWSMDDRAFSVWTKYLSASTSIDEFIFYRKEYSLIAKLLILSILGECERKSVFEVQQSGVKRIWYHWLWKNLVYDSPDFPTLVERLKTLKFVTFNYERSLEYFLSLQMHYLFPRELIHETSAMENGLISITHAYGEFGSLSNRFGDKCSPYGLLNIHEMPKDGSFGVGSGSSYGFEPKDSWLFVKYDSYLLNLALELQTYASSENVKTQSAIRATIEESENIYFFGFSFIVQNMNLLFDNEMFRRPRRFSVDGTCFLLSDVVIDRVRTYFKRKGIGTSFLSNKKLDLESFFADKNIKF